MNRADRSLKCDECESSFAKMAHLIRHKTSIHRSEVKPPPTIDPEALEQQQESTTLLATVKNETPSEVKPSLPKISGKPQLCTECGEFVQQRCPVFWRKVILVIFVIFELGPDSESLCNALPSESISCGIRAIFHPKNCL